MIVQERTLELLEDSVDGAGAAAAGHGDVELVGVRLRHVVYISLVYDCSCFFFYLACRVDVRCSCCCCCCDEESRRSEVMR